jgi:hypothetical protein
LLGGVERFGNGLTSCDERCKSRLLGCVERSRTVRSAALTGAGADGPAV